MYEYKLVGLGVRGNCEVCKNRVFTEAYQQVEVKHETGGYTSEGCTVLTGHKKCLQAKRKAGVSFLVNKGVPATS